MLDKIVWYARVVFDYQNMVFVRSSINLVQGFQKYAGYLKHINLKSHA